MCACRVLSEEEEQRCLKVRGSDEGQQAGPDVQQRAARLKAYELHGSNE